jgi:hypothetical protein
MKIFDKLRKKIYLKKMFRNKWRDFIDDENGEYEIKNILYHQELNAFLLHTYDSRIIRVRTYNKELKAKLMSISEIIGKRNGE